MEVEKYKKEIYKCIHCKTCRFAYSDEPDKAGYGDYTGIIHGCLAGTYNLDWEAYYNSGKMWILRGILEGDVPITGDLIDIFYMCTECGNCQLQCENEIPTVEIFETFRADLVRSGVEIHPKHKRFTEFAIKLNNPYGEPHEKRTEWFDGEKNRRSELAYFVGCTSSYRLPHVAKAVAKLLNTAGLEFLVSTEEVCCGSPLLRVGQREVALSLAKRNVENFKAAGVKRMLFSCAGCYRTFTVDYPKLLGNQPFETVSVMEMIKELMDKGVIKPVKSMDMTVTWHDPCHFGRHIYLWKKGSGLSKGELRDFAKKWFDIPREVLYSIPGLKVVEMYRNRENSWCCGAGGGVKAAYPEMALWAAYERIKEAKEAGAEAIVTSCPFCLRNLSDAAREFKSDVKIIDLTELVLQTL
ncbi:MAG: hypothetical protein DRN96_05200 [Thermoproteota archaeon]|nr:MAG: hypothetical protein DRN96_05200 [Candidatus Korarchaeota archaeon]RLG52955.1 MAG: hypothetical protein DRN99_07210 [Candidatus Korarchaeota archaeon]